MGVAISAFVDYVHATIRPNKTGPNQVVDATRWGAEGRGSRVAPTGDKRIAWREVCQASVVAVGVVVINSFVCIAVSWLAAICYAHGNILVGRSAQDQSRTTFLVGVLLWMHGVFSLCACVGRSAALFRFELVSSPGKPAGAIPTLRKMVHHTALWFALTTGIIVAIGYACASLPPAWSDYHLELYGSLSWTSTYVAAVEQAARRIYRKETI